MSGTEADVLARRCWRASSVRFSTRAESSIYRPTRTMAATMSAVAVTMAAMVSHQTPERARRAPGTRPNSMRLLHHDRAGVDVGAVALGAARGVVVHRDEDVD